MKAGRLRHKLEIQSFTQTRGSYGGEGAKVWVTKPNGEIRGAIRYLSGQDGFTADAYFGKNIVEFKIRYLSGVSVLDRIVYDNRNFNIIPPIKQPNDVNKQLTIIAEEEAE